MRACVHVTGKVSGLNNSCMQNPAGPEAAAQRVDEMAGAGGGGARRFFLQYYFPPSSVGETGRVGAPNRREIGHGQLAERALTPVIPATVSKSHWKSCPEALPRLSCMDP